MLKRKLNPQGLALVLDRPDSAQTQQERKIHLARRLLTHSGASRCLCGHPSSKAFTFPFYWFVWNNAPLCAECKKRADSMGLSNGS